MSLHKKLLKATQNLFRQILQICRSLTKQLMNWLLRSLLVIGRGSGHSQAGFLLPTVVMVLLVVTLLTTAIVFRSFDRAKTARNARIDEVVMAAAAPAIERAKAKLDTLFQDARLPRSTPSDVALSNLVSNDNNKYTFSDEERLKLAFNLDASSDIKEENPSLPLENTETLSTAWRFPVDTDNDGFFDSFTLYSIGFRSPSRDASGAFTRPRSPLDARTPPMDDGTGRGACQAALTTSAKLVSSAGWYKSGSKLKKSFFVYSVTVPITDKTNIDIPTADLPKYKNYQGSPGFSALEYQQDRARIPVSNNAVVFEDDLAIASGSDFRLNGSIAANSNLFVSSEIKPVNLYQVSSKDSCFYEAENSKISVGGNLVNALSISAATAGTGVPVHLFVEQTNPDKTKSISTTNQSAKTSESPQKVGYNNQAYTARINHLVEAWLPKPMDDDPPSVKEQVTDPSVPVSEQPKKRLEALTAYFKDRTRRVPFDEVAYGSPETFTPTNDPIGTGGSLRPPKEWMFPVEPSDGKAEGSYAKIGLNIGSKVQPPATEPETLRRRDGEQYIGDRVLVGNNMPAVWYGISDYGAYDSDNGGTWVTDKEGLPINGTNWDEDDNNPKKTRTRFTSVRSLSDVGDKSRDGFWEKSAAQAPKTLLDGVGGLRVVTGAGVYERKSSFLPPPKYDDPTTPNIDNSPNFNDPSTPSVTEQFPLVWPDTMPMSPGGVGSKVYNNATNAWIDLPTTLPLIPAPTVELGTNRKYTKGDLRMRATAVYHYAQDKYDPIAGDKYQAPLACVSSYYNPTDERTARNLPGLPDVSGDTSIPLGASDPGRKSNNGVVYDKPSVNARTLTGVTAPNAATGLFGTAPQGTEASTTLIGRLYYQANIVFPNGRFANEPLRNALISKASGSDLTLSEQSAIDSTICALQILKGGINPNPIIPHGAIKEVAFLDAREIKAIDKNDQDDPSVTTPTPAVETFTSLGNSKLTGNYDLSLEERQPLEIRATLLDLDLLRKTSVALGGGIPSELSPEYLLPNSGIIYASRDDALPDLSTKLEDILGGDTADERQRKKSQQRSESAVDYKLDPTRRPNGIMISNGQKLARNDVETFREAEKGLILATNLPAYVWGDFNIHSKEEFGDAVNASWSNFYTRSDPNENFACRPGDARLPNCTVGDTWRPATVIADSVSLLSTRFRFGFRHEGDYDLRNNHGDQDSINKRKYNGFFANDYATNGLSSQNAAVFGLDRGFLDTDYSKTNLPKPNSGSSYFNNFVTPVQRRIYGPEYVMEFCPNLLAAECKETDWIVGTAGTPTLKTSDASLTTIDIDTTPLLAGTTAQAPDPTWQRFPRRVAFQRDADGVLIAGPNKKPIPLGIDSDGKVKPFPSSAGALPREVENALWFRTTTTVPDTKAQGQWTYNPKKPLFYRGIAADNQGKLVRGTTALYSITSSCAADPDLLCGAPEGGGSSVPLKAQPLLVPVLQLHITSGNTPGGTNYVGGNNVIVTNWLQEPDADTTFNLVIAAGNTPPRTTTSGASESEGGLVNYPRFLENWAGKNAKISGSLMQLSRTSYATAPYFTYLINTGATNGGTSDLFGYPQQYRTNNNTGQVPFNEPANRLWGYDVGLLSQLPDLFASRFSSPSVGDPDEFFREVSRDDSWVSTLLCAKKWTPSGTGGSEPYSASPAAINDNQRPSTCL